LCLELQFVLSQINFLIAEINEEFCYISFKNLQNYQALLF